MINNKLEKMLALQSELQREAYGTDYATFADEQRMQSVRENVLALISEINEAMDETGWKPWATSNHINRDAFMGEMVDAWHFFMNLMLLGGITAQDLYDGYLIKRAKNLQRQRNGYDGLNKCPNCRRAYDDPSTQCRPRGPKEIGPWCQEVAAQEKREGW